MPRKEKVFPSLRPRILPHSSSRMGGLRLAPVAAAAADEPFVFSCPNALPAAPARAPPTRTVLVPSIFRRFIGPNGVFDVSSLIVPLILSLMVPGDRPTLARVILPRGRLFCVQK